MRLSKLAVLVPGGLGAVASMTGPEMAAYSDAPGFVVAASVYATSTLYTTSYFVVTECAADGNCPTNAVEIVTSAVIATTTTTVCLVTTTPALSPTQDAPQSSPTASWTVTIPTVPSSAPNTLPPPTAITSINNPSGSAPAPYPGAPSESSFGIMPFPSATPPSSGLSIGPGPWVPFTTIPNGPPVSSSAISPLPSYGVSIGPGPVVPSPGSSYNSGSGVPSTLIPTVPTTPSPGASSPPYPGAPSIPIPGVSIITSSGVPSAPVPGVSGVTSTAISPSPYPSVPSLNPSSGVIINTSLGVSSAPCPCVPSTPVPGVSIITSPGVSSTPPVASSFKPSSGTPSLPVSGSLPASSLSTIPTADVSSISYSIVSPIPSYGSSNPGTPSLPASGDPPVSSAGAPSVPYPGISPTPASGAPIRPSNGVPYPPNSGAPGSLPSQTTTAGFTTTAQITSTITYPHTTLVVTVALSTPDTSIDIEGIATSLGTVGSILPTGSGLWPSAINGTINSPTPTSPIVINNQGKKAFGSGKRSIVAIVVAFAFAFAHFA